MSLAEDLSVWQLLRLQTLLRMARRHAIEKCDDGGEAPAPCLTDVVFAPSSVAQSFVDKSFDQLREVCKACGLVFEAYQPKGGGVTVSLGKESPNDGAPAVQEIFSVDACDELLASVDVALQVDGKLSVEGVVQHVVQSAAALWGNMMCLRQLAPPDPMMNQLAAGMGSGMSPEMLKMMLAANAAAAVKPPQPELSEHERLLKAALDGVTTSVVRSDVSMPCSSLDETSGHLTITLSHAASHDAQLYQGVVLALQSVSAYWHCVSLRNMGDVYAPPKDPSGVPPLLLLAAVISADRRQRSSLLRFPRQLLEQVLWYVHSLQGDDAAWLAPEPLARHMEHRKCVEFPAPCVDEEPLDDETDEEYFARMRPKTYLDICAAYLPAKRKITDC